MNKVKSFLNILSTVISTNKTDPSGNSMDSSGNYLDLDYLLDLTHSLDDTARSKDVTMDLTTAVARLNVATMSTMKSYGGPISLINGYLFNPQFAAAASIKAAKEATRVALDADLSASNSHLVYNAMRSVQTAFKKTLIKESMTISALNNSISLIIDLLNVAITVKSNTSAHSAVAITRRASNTVIGMLNSIEEDERSSIEAAKDASDIVDLLIVAKRFVNVAPDVDTTFTAKWAVNAATGKANDVAEKIKNKAFLLNKTAHTLVTPQRIAIQTAAANAAGALNANYASRLDRASRNVFQDPPPAYASFKAGIRAKNNIPSRPSLQELVLRNNLQPLRLDSLRTLSATDVKIAEEVQKIRDTSAYSYRQQ